MKIMKRIGLSLLAQVILAAIITLLSIFLAEQQLKFYEVSHNGIIVGIAVLVFFVVEGYAAKMFFMKKIMKICSPEQQRNYSLLWMNIAIALLINGCIMFVFAGLAGLFIGLLGMTILSEGVGVAVGVWRVLKSSPAKPADFKKEAAAENTQRGQIDNTHED